MKKQIICKDAPSAVGYYSQAVEVNGMIFVSGQLPINAESGEVPEGIADQTRQTLVNIKSIIEEAGGQMDDMVKCSVYLADFDDFGEMNEVYREFFNDPLPARLAVEVARFPKNIKIEIDAIAIL